jgi:hypothetical protein
LIPTVASALRGVNLLTMRGVLALLLALPPAALAVASSALTARAETECNSFVASVCDPAPDVTAPVTPRVLRVTPRPPPFAVGDAFPLAEHSPLMNPERYDLPPAGDGWRYYRVRPYVFRIDTVTGRVLEVVTGGNRAMLR